MTATPGVPVLDADGVGEPVGRRSALRSLLREPLGLICTLYVLVMIVAAVLAPWLAPHDPNVTRIKLTNAPALSSDYLLGGDAAGRDILSRLLWATRSTLLACVVVLVVSVAIGVVSGLFAGFYRGAAEKVANWLSDTILALPGMVLLIALYSVIGTSITIAMAVFGIMIAPSYYRLVRGVVAGVRSELFVDAAFVAGLSDLRIIFRHVLSAVLPPVLIQSSFVLAAGISIQAGLEFLGLGDPQQPSWGGMLQLAFRNIYVNVPAVVWPAVLISVTILAFVLLGNALRDSLQHGSRHRGITTRARRHLQGAAESGAAADSLASMRPGGETGTDEPLLDVHGLSIGYPSSSTDLDEVVRSVDVSVRSGEIRGLVGESGSGKSQTVFAILGLLPKEAVVLGGTIIFDGDELLHRHDALKRVRGRRIAYVPQEPMSNLDPTLTVGQQLTYGLRAVRKISRRAARAELLTLLESVGITDPARVFDQYPHQVSGGMAQRVLITGAVASDPDVIIADEPTTALDVTVQADVLEILRGLRDDRGLGMLLVTHNLGVVADICDTVSVMQAGRIVETQTCRELFAAPEHPYTQELLASSIRGTDHV